MASFLENIEPFRGTGERNKDGQTLEEFLAGYQPYRYETPSCTTDAVVFSYRGMEEQIRDVNALEVLLVKRSTIQASDSGHFREDLSISEKIWKRLQGENFKKRQVSADSAWSRLQFMVRWTGIRARE